jgi:hypothetical protein
VRIWFRMLMQMIKSVKRSEVELPNHADVASVKILVITLVRVERTRNLLQIRNR